MKSYNFVIAIGIIAVILSLSFLGLGISYIEHLENKDKRHIELCEKLDCVNPKLTVQEHIRINKK